MTPALSRALLRFTCLILANNRLPFGDFSRTHPGTMPGQAVDLVCLGPEYSHQLTFFGGKAAILFHQNLAGA